MTVKAPSQKHCRFAIADCRLKVKNRKTKIENRIANHLGVVVGKSWKMRLSAENLTATAKQIIVPEPAMGMLTHGGLPCMQVSPGRFFLTGRRLIWYKCGKMKSVDLRLSGQD